MNIEKLSQNINVDLNAEITAVDFSDRLVITLQCDDWQNDEQTCLFKIVCKGVEESDVTPSLISKVDFTNSHPLLWNHNEPHGYLYYSSKPSNRYEILGLIWEAHEKLFGGWRQIADFANTYNSGQLISFCEGSDGLLANGPKKLMDIYQSAVCDKLQTNYVSSYNPEKNCNVLVFDTCFVVCSSVEVLKNGS